MVLCPLKPNFVNSGSDYFCLLALVELLLIMHRNKGIVLNDDELFELAINYAFKPVITIDDINKKLLAIRLEIKKQKTD